MPMVMTFAADGPTQLGMNATPMMETFVGNHSLIPGDARAVLYLR